MFPIVLVGGSLLGISAATVPGSYTPSELAYLGLVFTSLAASLVAAFHALAGAWRASRFVAAALLAFVLLWHGSEQWLVSVTHLVAWILVGALILAIPLTLVLDRAPTGRRARGWLALSSLVFLTTLLGGYLASPRLRWHLLRHNKLVGTPTYFALGPHVRDAVVPRWDAVDTLRVEPGASEPTEFPDVVLLVVDTLRADALPAYGAPSADAPFLSELAQDATVFTDVQSNSSWTRPSIATLFTGRLEEQHTVCTYADPLPEREYTLAESFADRGYRTAAFVTNPTAISGASGFAQGFETYHEYEEIPYRRAGEVAEHVLSWLAVREDDRPLFLYVHLLDPHIPYLSGVEPALGRRHDREAYRAEVRYLDGVLRRFVAALESRLDTATKWLLTSDHGEQFGEHGETGHGTSLHAEELAVPAILIDPERPADRISARLETRDLFELVSRALLDESIELASWAAARDRARRYASVYGEWHRASFYRPFLNDVRMRAVTHDGFKLIWSGYGDTLELYDLREDPGELRNLADQEPVRAARMLALLDAEARPFTARDEEPRAPAPSTEHELERLRQLGYAE